jgi:tetratricopeptide (TPR) repeat protein
VNPTFGGINFRAMLARSRYDALQVQLNKRYSRGFTSQLSYTYARGDVDRAEQLERKALAINREYAEAWNTLGAIYIVRRQPAAAVDALSVATRLAPRNAQAFHNLSLALGALDQADRARDAAAAACSIDKQYCR